VTCILCGFPLQLGHQIGISVERPHFVHDLLADPLCWRRLFIALRSCRQFPLQLHSIVALDELAEFLEGANVALLSQLPGQLQTAKFQPVTRNLTLAELIKIILVKRRQSDAQSSCDARATNMLTLLRFLGDTS
jgi:hypothetical protein